MRRCEKGYCNNYARLLAAAVACGGCGGLGSLAIGVPGLQSDAAPDLGAPDLGAADLGEVDLADLQASEVQPLDPSCPHPQQLEGHITPEIAVAPFAAAVPPDLVIHIGIGLPMRHPDASVPDSGALTPEEFTDLYGATVEDYQALLDWARASGFTQLGTFGNRLLVSADGTAALIERTFCVNLNYYLRPDGSLFYAPDREPSVDCPVPVDYISNLTDYAAPHGPRGVP
jgi:hypothetical protein